MSDGVINPMEERKPSEPDLWSPGEELPPTYETIRLEPSNYHALLDAISEQYGGQPIDDVHRINDPLAEGHIPVINIASQHIYLFPIGERIWVTPFASTDGTTLTMSVFGRYYPQESSDSQKFLRCEIGDFRRLDLLYIHSGSPTEFEQGKPIFNPPPSPIIQARSEGLYTPPLELGVIKTDNQREVTEIIHRITHASYQARALSGQTLGGIDLRTTQAPNPLLRQSKKASKDPLSILKARVRRPKPPYFLGTVDNFEIEILPAGINADTRVQKAIESAFNRFRPTLAGTQGQIDYDNSHLFFLSAACKLGNSTKARVTLGFASVWGYTEKGWVLRVVEITEDLTELNAYLDASVGTAKLLKHIRTLNTYQGGLPGQGKRS